MAGGNTAKWIVGREAEKLEKRNKQEVLGRTNGLLSFGKTRKKENTTSPTTLLFLLTHSLLR
jgi:hypothetical protein